MSNAKLNQIIAIEKGVKARANSEITNVHKINQKPALFGGFAKTYQSIDENGEKLPAESQRVQVRSGDVLEKLEHSQSELMTIAARKDWTNMSARADVVLDGKVVLASVPATHLLFLEKQLTDAHTFFSNLPLLDEAEDWKFDENAGLYKTDPVQTHRTKKKQTPLVMYPATPEHPAQTQLITEDVISGFWNTVKMSGAMKRPDVESLVERCEALLNAVKQAREGANMTEEVDSPDVGRAVFGYLFAKEA
jgi:hypothetical protein